jgi:hypothetical protein
MPAKGSKLTEEHKARIAAANKERGCSEETRERLRMIRTGSHHTDSSRAKMSASWKGRTFTDDHRAKISAAKMGFKHTDDARKKMSAAKTGSKWSEARRAACSPGKGDQSPNWRGGVSINSGGYICDLVPDHPHAAQNGYVRRHRLVVEKAIGRYLDPEEVVHHIDGDKLNNSIENLMLFATTRDHTIYHSRSQEDSP